MRAGVLNQQRAATRVAEDRGGDFHVHGGAFAARCGNFVGQALRVGAAEASDGAVYAVRRLRCADYLAEFHQGLIPIAGGFRSEQIVRGCGERTPICRSAQIATNGIGCAPGRARRCRRVRLVEHRKRCSGPRRLCRCQCRGVRVRRRVCAGIFLCVERRLVLRRDADCGLGCSSPGRTRVSGLLLRARERATPALGKRARKRR